MAYQGQTERGRLVRENTIEACVESLAFVAGKDAAACCTTHIEGWGKVSPLWYVYDSADAQRRDADANGAAERVNWFAVISEAP